MEILTNSSPSNSYLLPFSKMTATIALQRQSNPWNQFCEWVTSTDNRLYVGWFGVLRLLQLLYKDNLTHGINSVNGLPPPTTDFMWDGLVC